MPLDTPAPLRPRLKLLLAAALAAGSILLPLAPVWRYTGHEIEALMAERALLDPLARAVALQRSLLGHADVSARVLRGRQALETERRHRQHAVEADLLSLQATLSAGLWTRALGETHALTHDWRALVWQVAQRSIAEARSWDGHQLLVEQAVLVMDLVSAAAPADETLHLVLHPRADTAAWEAALLAREQRVSQRLAALHETRAGAAAAAGASFVLLLGLGLALGLARNGPPAPAPGAPPRDDVRRSRGRRRTDFAGFDPVMPWTAPGELSGSRGGRAAADSDLQGPRRRSDD
jgi:hypothetical protein